MSNWSVNKRGLIGGTIDEPRAGRWVAHVSVQGTDALTTPVTIRCENGPHEWTGDVVHQSSYQGYTEAVVHGCAALDNVVPATGYMNTTAAIVARELLQAAKATQSASSNTAGQLARWSRTKAQAGAQLDALCVRAGATWHVERDGSVFVGTPTVTTLETKAIERDRDTRLQSIHYVCIEPDIRPRSKVNGEAVDSVLYDLRDGSCVALVTLANK